MIGELQTREILQVTDQYDRSNYTFLLTSIESTNTSVKSTFNLIVKESDTKFFSYIMEYRPNENWTYNSLENFSTFTGEILYYDTDGKYLAKETLSNGTVITAETRNSCPDDDTPDGDPNNGGDGTSDGNDGTSDGNDGGDGGSGITIYEEEVCNIPCTHPEHNPHADPCQHPTCETVIVINHKSSTKVDNHVKAPCPDTNESCHQQNNDPCPNGCNADQTGCLEVTNDEVGINVDLPCAIANSTINENSPFNVDLSSINPCTSDSENIITPEDELLLCLYEKLSENALFKDFFINTFGESENMNVTIKVVDEYPEHIVNQQAAGVTHSQAITVNTQTGELISADIDILIRRGYMNQWSTMSIAKTLLHEALHAYLIIQLSGCGQSGDLEGFDNLDVGELVNQYYGSACAGQEQHEFMFELLLPFMTQILSDLRDNLIPETHQGFAESIGDFHNEQDSSGDTQLWNWDQFFLYVSLNGLQNTNAYQNNIENSPAKAFNFNRYNDVAKNSFSRTYCAD